MGKPDGKVALATGGFTVKSTNFYFAGVLGATVFLVAGSIGGCNGTNATPQHQDEVDSVVHALIVNGLYKVSVSLDRTKGVMTLTGNVQSQDQKTYAAQIAHKDASDYTIANDIGVIPPPAVSQLIVGKYKAMLQAQKNLDQQDIDYEAKNGTLVSSGTVHSAHERVDFVRLAKSVPNVERVVNQIKVKRWGYSARCVVLLKEANASSMKTK
jgi:hyperosmotically inducible periplasmic protein